AMGVRLLRGRAFTDADGPGQAEVAVVNEAMARKHWPGEDAVGKRFSYGSPTGPWITVVGVIAASRKDPGQEAAAELYTPLAQRLMGPQVSTIVLRTAGDPAQLGPAARSAIR